MNRTLPGLLFIALAACAPPSASPAAEQSGRPSIRQIQIAPDVGLEVVDWGGEGQPLVLLAGLGNTAHVFEDFASHFVDRFHIYGITRRGFGASATAPPPTSIDTLVADIVAVLDTLNLDSVVLAGHSIAGEELTLFGEKHGDRCAALVYVDAAFDRTAIGALFQKHPIPPPPPMQTADSASVDAVRAYWARIHGSPFPISEIQASKRFANDGRFSGDVTPDSLTGRVMAGARKPNYSIVECPSLAVYAIPNSTVDALPYYNALDPAGRRTADELFTVWKPLTDSARRAFNQNPRNRSIQFPGATHYLFLQHPAAVADSIRAFLAGLK
jgi:pimeloyl-ACP methyl ester carboxylesterase